VQKTDHKDDVHEMHDNSASRC